ncbi:MAG: Gfo/Idh/MocA family oxidoreductase [Candidatus Gracilibacteria bacterium]|jgi:predicted dehydrogenase
MRVAIIGAGSIGQRHARDAAALGHDVLRYDVVRERSDVETVDELWAWRPEAAVICTWPDSHVGWGVEAAQHGCHLFVEKPLALDMADLGQLSLEAAGRTVHVACPLRYVAELRDMWKRRDRIEWALVDAGYHLPTVTPGYHTSYHASTGVLLDIGSHALDLLQWLFGPASVQECKHARSLTIDLTCDDYAVAKFSHANGRYSGMAVDWISAERHWFVETHGGGRVERCDVPANIDAAYRAEMAAFLAACEAGRPADNPLVEAAATLSTLLEAKRWAAR